MHAHLTGLDHVVILVTNLDAALATFTRLGFKPTPRGFHSIGTRNHCLMLGNDYLELLAIDQRHPVTQYFSDFLAVSEGAAAIALRTDDAHAACASLRASGIEADSPVDFSRPVALPEGDREARFRVVQLPVDATPGARTFLCQHFTPELVWRADYQEHPLGVTGIAGVTILADAAQAAAAAHARVFEVPAESRGTGWRVNAGSAEILVANSGGQESAGVPRAMLPTRKLPVIGALTLRVRDRVAAAETLRRGGFAAQQLESGSWAVGADESHGVALIFS